MITNKLFLRQRLLGVAVATAASIVMLAAPALAFAAGSVHAKEDDSGEGMACYDDGSGCRPCESDRECSEGRGPRPKPVAWRPWQQIWQCNDIRLAVTSRDQGLIEYDVSGTIWGGSRFAVDFRPRSGGPEGAYWFNGRPCVRFQ
jgi:hypothetical protein